MPDGNSAIELLSSLLHEAGYQALPHAEFGFVGSGVGGVKIALYPLETRSLHLSCLFLNNIYDAATLNKFNAAYRFIKAYCTDEGNLFLVTDHVFDMEAEGASEKLDELLQMFSNSITGFAQFNAVISADQVVDGGSF